MYTDLLHHATAAHKELCGRSTDGPSGSFDGVNTILMTLVATAQKSQMMNSVGESSIY